MNRVAIVDTDRKVVVFSTDDLGEWEHEKFQCLDCMADVILPDGWDVDYE